MKTLLSLNDEALGAVIREVIALSFASLNSNTPLTRKQVDEVLKRHNVINSLQLDVMASRVIMCKLLPEPK